MNRKSFLSSTASVVGLTALSPLSAFDSQFEKETITTIKPPYLKKGDLIGITAPAGYITLEEIQPAIKKMEDWGYKIRIGKTIGEKNYTFAGSDEERTNDLQQMLDDPKIKAIMFARGGYGAIRIIDRIKWEKFKLRPKWVIGFSDITVFHSHINRHFGIASIHSKMCNSFPEDWINAEPIQIETIESIQKALSGEKMSYSVSPNANNRLGIAYGPLVGGNMKTLEALAGSSSDLRTTGKILFLEDTGEYLYSIDRMFWNWKRSGKLSGLKGLIIGGFRVKVDTDTEDFGKTVEQIVMEKVKNYRFPVCFDFPVGHQRNNFALKCSVNHQLSVSKNEALLKEI